MTPYAYVPDVSRAGGGITGVGDTVATFFVIPAHTGKIIWGVGPSLLIPTATGDNLGAGKWDLGPSVAIIMQPNWGSAYVVAQNIWSLPDGQTVIIVQPANPQVVYVPTYNPQTVYVAAPPPPSNSGNVAAAAVIGFALAVVLFTACKSDEKSTKKQETFASAEDAVAAMVDALATNNEDKLVAIFGPEARDAMSSGDAVADQRGRDLFVAAYKERSALVEEDQRKTLHIGREDWPFPIPLVKEAAGWRFDTPAGIRRLS